MREKEICIEVDEKLYEEIQKVRGIGYSLVEIIEAGIEAIKSRAPQKLVNYRPCGEIAKFSFMFPSREYEEYEKALCFEVDDSIYYIAYGFREAFGAMRRRVVVIKVSRRGKPQHVLAEFAGADDWSNTKLVAALLKKHDDSYVRIGEAQNMPEYKPLGGCIEEHAKVIKEGKKGYAALVVKEDDYEKILYYAIKRLEMKRRKQ
jgi:hypothetical protein